VGSRPSTMIASALALLGGALAPFVFAARPVPDPTADAAIDTDFPGQPAGPGEDRTEPSIHHSASGQPGPDEVVPDAQRPTRSGPVRALGRPQPAHSLRVERPPRP
jgi:hypothetical protein